MTELRTRIEEVIRNEVAPILGLDGTGIEVLGIENSCARVRLNGACAGCPATVMFIVQGIEQELRKRISEVEYLEVAP